MPTSEVDMETEALNAQSQSLVLLPRERDILIDREPCPSRNGVQREMIPLGGLKVWSTAQIPWVSLLRELEHFDRELEDAPGGDSILYGFTATGSAAQLHFEIQIPFGMFNLAQEDIDKAFTYNSLA